MRPLLERTLSTAGQHRRRKKKSESHSHLSPSIVHSARDMRCNLCRGSAGPEEKT